MAKDYSYIPLNQGEMRKNFLIDNKNQNFRTQTYLGTLYTQENTEEEMMRAIFSIFFSVYSGLEMAMYLSTVTERVRKAEPILQTSDK